MWGQNWVWVDELALGRLLGFLMARQPPLVQCLSPILQLPLNRFAEIINPRGWGWSKDNGSLTSTVALSDDTFRHGQTMRNANSPATNSVRTQLYNSDVMLPGGCDLFGESLGRNEAGNASSRSSPSQATNPFPIAGFSIHLGSQSSRSTCRLAYHPSPCSAPIRC